MNKNNILLSLFSASKKLLNCKYERSYKMYDKNAYIYIYINNNERFNVITSRYEISYKKLMLEMKNTNMKDNDDKLHHFQKLVGAKNKQEVSHENY